MKHAPKYFLFLNICFIFNVNMLISISYLQVQETARSIIDNLEGDHDSEQMTSPVTSPMTSSPSGGSTRADKAAVKWSMAFCEFYRDNWVSELCVSDCDYELIYLIFNDIHWMI